MSESLLRWHELSAPILRFPFTFFVDFPCRRTPPSVTIPIDNPSRHLPVGNAPPCRRFTTNLPPPPYRGNANHDSIAPLRLAGRCRRTRVDRLPAHLRTPRCRPAGARRRPEAERR